MLIFYHKVLLYELFVLYLHSKLSKQAKQRGKKIAVRREAVFSKRRTAFCNTLLAK